MARSIQKIQQDLTDLGAKVTELQTELHNRYGQYLEVLSQAIQKQLILAGYQLCTQIYPEAFLNLSFKQRQTLQENLRKIGKKAQSELVCYLELPSPNPSPQVMSLMEQILRQLPQPENLTNPSPELTPETSPKTTNPEELIQWCKHLEEGIIDVLDNLSHEANQLFQQSQILPSRLPPKLLDMAIQAEEGGAPISGSNNLLNLLIESPSDHEENSQESHQDARITKVTAIHLRLSEIEFTEPSLSLERNQIRHLLEQLSKLRQQYRQKRKELALTEAESAWRASWYEE